MGRVGMMLVAFPLLIHFMMGFSLLHGLTDQHDDLRGPATDVVAASVPTGAAVVACSDGGACSLADRPPTPVGQTLGVVLIGALAILLVATPAVLGRRSGSVEPGPAPPLHLSAQVVLVI